MRASTNRPNPRSGGSFRLLISGISGYCQVVSVSSALFHFCQGIFRDFGISIGNRQLAHVEDYSSFGLIDRGFHLIELTAVDVQGVHSNHDKNGIDNKAAKLEPPEVSPHFLRDCRLFFGTLVGIASSFALLGIISCVVAVTLIWHGTSLLLGTN
jgi:hypothetical protein